MKSIARQVSSDPRHDVRQVDSPRGLLEHLADLRRCLIGCLGSWLSATLIIAPFAPYLLELLLAPLVLAGRDPEALVRGQRLGIGFSVLFRLMLWGGIVLSLPLLMYFVAQFIFPGLLPRERRAVRLALAASGTLFLAGVFLAYKTTLALAIEALFAVSDWMGIEIWPLLLDDYIGMVIKTLLAFGLAFQLPLVLLALGWCGIVSATQLRAARRHAIVAIFIMAMLLTPPEPISQIAMALPMWLLYELCIFLISMRRHLRPPPP